MLARLLACAPQVLIAKEMSRILGLGTNIPDASGLPKLDEDGKVGLGRVVAAWAALETHLRLSVWTSCCLPALPWPAMPCCLLHASLCRMLRVCMLVGLCVFCQPPGSPLPCLPSCCALQIPKDLQKYAQTIVEADGFAQVYPEHKVGAGGRGERARRVGRWWRQLGGILEAARVGATARVQL